MKTTTAPAFTEKITYFSFQKAQINSLYKIGKAYYEIDDLNNAKYFFNKAVKLSFCQPESILSNPDFIDFRNDLINDIYLIDSDLVEKQDDGEDLKAELLDEENVVVSKEDEQKEIKILEESKVKYSFPVVVNDKVLAFIKAYSTKLKPVIEGSLKRSGRYIDMYKKIFRERGLPDDLAYLPIIESGFKIYAYSRARAKGIWQFVTGTARLEGLRVDWWVDERCDPEKSAIAAANHLKKLYEHYNDWYLALAAYNAGQGKIDRAIRRAKTRDFWKIARHRWLLRRETKNYVPAFIAALIIAKNPEKYGFTNLDYDKPLEYDTVKLDSCTDLRVVAKLCNTSVETIRKLNPSLRRLTTPVRDKNFKIKIPKGLKDDFLAKYSKLPPNKRVTLRYHRIRRGESLYTIARRYRTTVSAICKANGIRNRRLIRAGRVIVIPIGRGGNYYIPKVRDNTIVRRRYRYKRGRRFRYRVRRGDSLYKIAVKFRTDVASIKKWNKLSSNFLKPGKVLTVYYGISYKRKKRSHKTKRHIRKRKVPRGYYRVKRGDSLYSIAKKFHTTVRKIKKLNKLRSSRIKPGQLIKVR